MDGTLVETEQCWGEAMSALAERLGGTMSAAARQATVGTSMATAMRILAADLGLRRTDEQLRADGRWVEDEVAGLLAGELVWRPGARELLGAVRGAGLPLGLVTTTPRRLTDVVLQTLGDGFDVIVCGDEVPARKPDPAPYRQAAAALGVDPADAVVVEDSPTGVDAGLAAGAAVLGVPSLAPLPPAPGLVVRDSLAGVSLPDLADVLAQACADAGVLRAGAGRG